MKYSTVLVAATFAVGAFARAVPEGSNPVRDEINAMGGHKADEYDDNKEYDDGKKNKEYDDGKNKKEYDDGKKNKEYDDSTKKHDDKKDKDYGKPTYDDKEWKDYEDKQKKYDDAYYKPAPKKAYEDYKDDKDHKYYSPRPEKYDDSKSCYKDFEWPTNVHKEKPCNIKWAPKHGGEWKDDDETVVYLYHCKDYSKPKEKVCHDCGKGEYKEWKPKSDCESSDADNGAMYRFKFCKKSNEEEFTWGEEFPIYGDKYDDKKEAQCPPPKPVPECPEAPPTPPPVKEAAPAPAPEYPAPAAPAPAAEAAPAAPAPEYPAAVAPQQGVANETTLAPVYPGTAGSIRASVSVIVGVAALITFAL